MSDQQLVLFEFAPVPEPSFTYAEYAEIMGWRIARMKEAGTFPSFKEINIIVTRVLAEHAPRIADSRANDKDVG